MTPLFWKYLIVSAKRKKFVSMWVKIASHMDDLPVQFSFKNLCEEHKCSRSGLHRHMEEVKQFWDKSGIKLGQRWYRGGVEFQQVKTFSQIKLEQTWDKPKTKVKQVKHPKTQDEYEEVRAKIIDYLNQKTGKKYRTSNKQTKKDIDARLKEGYAYADFCKVIDNKTKVWKGTQQEIYLRPVTLFGNKFDSYLNENPQNPKMSMHQQISNHVTKAERYNNAISEAEGIDFTQFVKPDERDKGHS
mgnify:CR=1 FL=1|jgi:uncharacterized phage protein (TIGR02220 family)|tara:strand:- start:1329 stop:2060 length:732 start_codon:yes stop_codon:yes gene_type:complete